MCQQTPETKNRAADSILHTFDSINNSLKDLNNKLPKETRAEYAFHSKGWANDFEGILSTSQVMILDSLISKFEKETKIEIAIVSLDSSMVGRLNFDDYVTKLGSAWGVGKIELQNGIVIGMSAALNCGHVVNELKYYIAC